MKLARRIRNDENLHRSAFAIIGHELTDWLLVANLLSWAIVTFTLPFWVIMLGAVFSVSFGIFQAHWLIELHDRFDKHKVIAEIKEETWLYE